MASSLEASPLSVPGSPYAFSTALRPLPTEQSNQRPGLDVAGRLSLGSVGSDVPPILTNDNVPSPNATATSDSLGLLDLDAMEDSGASQFLRSSLTGGILKPVSDDITAPPSNQIPVFPPSTGPLDSSSESELALSPEDLEQLDVTLSDEFEHTLQEKEEMQSEQNGGYNPFEGCEGGDVGEFESQQDQVSFLRELQDQEEELKKAVLTPSDSRMTSFASGCPQTDRSLDSYFKEKSNKMGLLSSKLSPSQRPRFNDTLDHTITSPDGNDVPGPPHLPSTGPSPFSIPPLELSQSLSLGAGQGLHSMYLRQELPSFEEYTALTQHTPITHSFAEECTPTPSTSLTQHTPTPSTSLTQHTVGALPSHYLHTEQSSSLVHTSQSQQSSTMEDSTLMFPEVSTGSSILSHAHYHLATPPSAYLPQGFEVTTFINQSTDSVGEMDKTVTSDTSHVVSIQDHVTPGESELDHVTSKEDTVLKENQGDHVSLNKETEDNILTPKDHVTLKKDHVTIIHSSTREKTLSLSLTTSDSRLLTPHVPTHPSPPSQHTPTPSPPPSQHTPTRPLSPPQAHMPTRSSPPSQHTPIRPSPLCTTTKRSPVSPARSPVPDVPTDWLEVCSCVQFPSAVCVGGSVSEWVELTNKGDRWVQVSLVLTQCTKDGQEVSPDSVFSLSQRLFIGPENKERVKVTFSPAAEGVYNGVVTVTGSLVVSNTEQPLTTLQLCGRGEAPRLTVSPSAHALDFGSVVGGSQVALPLEMSNDGSCPLPLKVTLNTEDPLHKMYFTVVDTGQTAPSSPRSHPNALTLSLPPHPHNKPRPLHIELSAPKMYYSETSRPPLTIKGSLDISVDSPTLHTSHKLSTLPLSATVGVAKLLAPGSFQSDEVTLTCPVGQTKSQRVPLKNAGNIPLSVTVATSQPTLFLVTPHSLQLQPGQESHIDVTFIPISDPGTSEVTLQLHIEPTGPDYNLNMRGVALPVSSVGVALPVSEERSTVSWDDKKHPKNGHISEWLSGVSRDQSSQITPPHITPPHLTPPSHLTRPSHPQEISVRRSVYIREEEMVFPPTPLNTRSTLKVQVCNRDLPLAIFTVLKPSSPFAIDHRSFKLAARQCARLPIHFAPALPGKYSAIIALKTDSKLQVFVVVRGESPQPMHGNSPRQ